MSGLPSDCITRLNESEGAPRNGFLTMPRLTLLMDINAAREIEHLLDRRGDVGDEFDPGHAESLETIAIATSPRGNLALFTRMLHA